MSKVRVISLAVAAVMGISLFAGCSKTEGNKTGSTTTATTAAAATQKPAETVTLKIWGGVPAENGPDKVCENFTKEFESKGIKAVYERFVNDDNGNLKLDTALMAGEDVDLFVNYSISNLKKRTTANSTTDLTPFFQKDNFDPEKELGPIVKEYYVDGKPVALPTILATNNAWIVNKNMFDDAGIPLPTDWTLDELRDIAKKLTKGEGDSKVYGIMWATDVDKQFALSVAANKLGGNFLFKNNNESESNFDSPDMLKALKVITDMMLVDKTAVAHADMITQKLVPTNLFTEGKVAMVPHSWIVRDVKNKEKFPHDFVTAFVPAPKMDKDQKDVYAMGTGIGDFIAISAKSPNKDQAWEYLKWYATMGMVDMIPGGRIPAYKGFDKAVTASTFMAGVESLFDEKSFKEIFLKSYDKYQISHIQTKLPELVQIAKEECENAMAGANTPEVAMENAKKRADEILKK